MSDATTDTPSNTSGGQTIRPEEAAHFGKLAQDWWDPKGSSAMLHKLNPVRLQFLRDAIDVLWAGDIRNARPLVGKSALDVGCGAGLVCEPLRRLGAEVTGVDASAENVGVASAHAEAAGAAQIDTATGGIAIAAGPGGAPEPVEEGAGQVAVILYTTGTTGASPPQASRSRSRSATPSPGQ